MRKLRESPNHSRNDLNNHDIEILRLLYRQNKPLSVMECVRLTDQLYLRLIARLEYLLTYGYVTAGKKEGVDIVSLTDKGKNLVSRRNNKETKLDISKASNSIFQLADRIRKEDLIDRLSKQLNENTTTEAI